MRLEKLAEEMGAKVDITWKSFLLRPEREQRSMEKFTQYTETWKRPASMEPEAKFNQWSGEHEPPSHSVPALVASKAVEDIAPDKWDAFHHTLMEAYFVENRTISDLKVQLDVAEEVGIDREDLSIALSERISIYANEVIADHNDAVRAGVTGVPAVVAPGGFVIPGAQDVEIYRNIVQRLLDNQDRSAPNDL